MDSLQTYRNKAVIAIEDADNIDKVQELGTIISKSSQVNRRTKAGRELTEELLKLCNNKVQELADAGEEPF